jgi:hypothetical protein
MRYLQYCVAIIIPAKDYRRKGKVKRYEVSTILDTSYEDAIYRVKNALKEEGFGVLTEINVKAILKKSWVGKSKTRSRGTSPRMHRKN